jgi:hypothetical protein
MHNTLSEKEKEDGWKLLFDGYTKQGWHIYNHQSNGDAWVVKDGCLHLTADKIENYKTVNGGDLLTDEEYGEFHFKADWKLQAGGNSGIIFLVNESPELECTWHSGPEMQLLDNEGHTDGQIEKHRAGDLYDLVAAKPNIIHPAGEWNTSEIIIKNQTLVFRLNNYEVLSTNLWNDSWKQLIASSKFKNFPVFGIHKKGKIALQDHRDPVWFRNVKISC